MVKKPRVVATRRVTLRDFVIFQVKLALDGLKGLVVIQLSVLAMIVDFFSGRGPRPRHFYSVVRVSERFDAWLNLYGAVQRLDAGETEDGAPAAPTYVSLEPAFVVNFQDAKKRTKFLKAEISVVAGSAQAQEALTLHMPAVRNSLVLLLSRQVFEELSTNEGKEKLRGDALAAVQDVVKKQTSDKTAKAVKDLYFSSLVMQ